MSASRRKRAASTNNAALDDGEALAATRAARGEHSTAAGSLHARAKSMHARTSAGLRLIGALQGRVPSPAETKRSKTTMCALEHSSSVASSPWGIVRGLPKRAVGSSVFPFGVASGGQRVMVVGSYLLHGRREGEPLNLKQLWTAALGELQVGLSRAQYDTWFKDTQVLSEEDDVFLIGVPNAFAREWLESKFRPQVRAALQHLIGRTVDVRFVTSSGPSQTAARTSAAPGMTSSASGAGGQQPSGQERREAGALLNSRYTFSTFVG